MCKIIVVNNVTLDGVVQTPGRPDEDVRGGFGHGGWALPYSDAAAAKGWAARSYRSGGGPMRTRTPIRRAGHPRADHPPRPGSRRSQNCPSR
jgi:hypothetical protein